MMCEHDLRENECQNWVKSGLAQNIARKALCEVLECKWKTYISNLTEEEGSHLEEFVQCLKKNNIGHFRPDGYKLNCGCAFCQALMSKLQKLCNFSLASRDVIALESEIKKTETHDRVQRKEDIDNKGIRSGAHFVSSSLGLTYFWDIAKMYMLTETEVVSTDSLIELDIVHVIELLERCILFSFEGSAQSFKDVYDNRNTWMLSPNNKLSNHQTINMINCWENMLTNFEDSTEFECSDAIEDLHNLKTSDLCSEYSRIEYMYLVKRVLEMKVTALNTDIFGCQISRNNSLYVLLESTNTLLQQVEEILLEGESDDVTKLKAENEYLKKQLKQLSKQNNELKEETVNRRQLELECSEAKTKVQILEEELIRHEKEKINPDDLKQLKSENERLLEQSEQLSRQYNQLKEETVNRRQLELECSEAKTKVQKLEEELIRHEKEKLNPDDLKQLRSENERLTEQSEQLSRQNNELKGEIVNRQQLESECSEGKIKVQRLEEEFSRHEREKINPDDLKQLKSENEKLTGQLEQLTRKYSQLKEKNPDADPSNEDHTAKTALLNLKKSRSIIFLGGVGAGKTTLIHSFIKYILGDQMADPSRYRKTGLAEGKDHQDMVKAELITSYVLSPELDDPLTCRLELIDTAGFSVVKNLERDIEILHQLRRLFIGNSISSIEAVCIVVKEPTNRSLNLSEQYNIHMIMSVFGKDITENICIFVTFATCHDPPNLTVNLPLVKYFFINNVQTNEHESSALSHECFREFFGIVNEFQPNNLEMTKTVLNAQVQLESVSKKKLCNSTEVHNKIQVLRETIERKKQHLNEVEMINSFIMKPAGYDSEDFNPEAYLEKLKKASENAKSEKEKAERLENKAVRLNNEIQHILELKTESDKLNEILENKALTRDPLTQVGFLDILIGVVKKHQGEGNLSRLEMLGKLKTIAENLSVFDDYDYELSDIMCG